MKLTTASKITLIRVALIPVFLVLMWSDFTGHMWWALGLFILASGTDWVDGYVARHYNQVSSFGKFIDPLADKLLVTAAMMVFVEWGQFPAWAAILVLTREFAVTGLRLVAVEGGRVIAAGWSGKVKTFSTMICMCLMLTPWHASPLGGLGWLTIDSLSTWIIVITTVWSGLEYFVKNRDVFN